MYHVIGQAPAGDPLAKLFVTPDSFAGQVAALAAAGYQGITLLAAHAIWNGGPGPAKPIVLTFDDGYLGDYGNAMQILAARHWPAVLNLETSRLNSPGGLTTKQVVALLAQGWEVDDHTQTHPDLTTLSPARLTAEIGGAADEIAALVGTRPAFFAYPSGRYDATVVAAVRAAGFLGAMTTWPGLADPAAQGPFTLDRVRVDGGESPAQLVRMLAVLGAEASAAAPARYP